VKGGSVEAKLNGYFNTSCLASAPIVGGDGIGTAFGNSATGIVNGPGQANIDLALAKNVPFFWHREGRYLQFRGELYNALNHPQFGDPDNNYTSPAFGVISQTAVSARVVQLVLRLGF
jgi:hypothetical protein